MKNAKLFLVLSLLIGCMMQTKAMLRAFQAGNGSAAASKAAIGGLLSGIRSASYKNPELDAEFAKKLLQLKRECMFKHLDDQELHGSHDLCCAIRRHLENVESYSQNLLLPTRYIKIDELEGILAKMHNWGLCSGFKIETTSVWTAKNISDFAQLLGDLVRDGKIS